jgi:uncharacterized damage-inducible protein DinB
MENNPQDNRRGFLKKSAIFTAGLATTPFITQASDQTDGFDMPIGNDDDLYMVGPMKGYTPHIGTLLSTMNLMRNWVIGSVKNLTAKQLDFQIDEQSNSIGAMLLHLAATERAYQLNTFEGYNWGAWPREKMKDWLVAQRLGKKGREQIKGHEVSYYLDKLKEVRDVTKKEFAKRDDKWLQKSEPFFGGKFTNNYCKWFHVCEHESNHRGQIKFIKKRLPK